jgi:polysaccharide biosynthesis protein PslH
MVPVPVTRDLIREVFGKGNGPLRLWVEGPLAAMRVLLLTITSPIPANNGVKMRTSSILNALAAEGHEVVLVTFADQSESNGRHPELSKICKRVISVPHALKSLSSSRDYVGRAKQLISGLPYGVGGLRSVEMATQLAQLLGPRTVDVILCEQTDLLVNTPAPLPLPLIVDFHNVDYLILERYLRFERNPAKRLYARLESQKLREWERRACQLATVAMACSEHDRVILQQMRTDLPISVVPNVVDINEYHPGDNWNVPKILFQGGMDWYPNRDAVEFFVAEILPLIRNQIPDARFVVAGRNPPEEFRRRLCQVPGVEFTGTVPDMRVEIASAAVCVVPLRIGSGTRLKILEAAAMAKPIVSTHLGAEGLNFLNGKEIMLEDDFAAFASTVVRLLTSPSERRQLGQAARKRVEEDYSFPAMRLSVRSAISTLNRKTAVKDSKALEQPGERLAEL